jgi:hypothetical protein
VRLAPGAALLVVVACHEPSPTGPPETSLLGGLLQGPGLLTCSPLAPYSAAQGIGPEGGVLEVGPHTLVVPSGALSQVVTLGAEVVSEPVNRIRFQPEGLRFREPAALTMSYANCDRLPLLPRRIAYTSERLALLDYLLSWDDAGASRVTAELHHFSSYAVAW